MMARSRASSAADHTRLDDAAVTLHEMESASDQATSSAKQQDKQVLAGDATQSVNANVLAHASCSARKFDTTSRSRLLNLPPEIIEQIAYLCAVTQDDVAQVNVPQDVAGGDALVQIDTSAASLPWHAQHHPSATPPSHLLAFLLTCRQIYTLLHPPAAPHLYARIFRNRFDVAAIERRFGPKAIAARNLCAELQKRCRMLKRIRAAVLANQLKPLDVAPLFAEEEMTENLWLAYMMLVENDGLNMVRLKWALLDGYLRLHDKQIMLEAPTEPVYPPDTLDRSLALHVAFLFTDPLDLAKESRGVSDTKLFVLRPFVFAAHKFDSYVAPWTVRRLPLASQDDPAQSAATAANASPPPNPFLADLIPRSRETEITHCGIRMKLFPPILSHAACFTFFAKVERDPAVIGLTPIQDLNNPSATREDVRANRNPLAFRSIDHDTDLSRLLACSNPFSAPGLKPLAHAGLFEGAWEGRFCFFDFDSYREMLAGRMRSLYEGPFGEQPQVWRIREHIVRVGSGVRKIGGEGSVLNAGYLNGEPEPDAVPSVPYSEAVATINPSRPAHNGTSRNNRFNIETDSRTGQITNAGDYAELAKRGFGSLEDAQMYPSFGDDEGCPPGDSEAYEILLSGTGHSAWGRFILRGRIRSWDGMMIMTKEYRPDGRGRWLYRGYAVAGGRLVGRWRDTFTPENMSGYEGCFLLSRRDSAA
ncbi:hypothetical protein CBOM_06708 [Ceraceosorus bombacis]|uniref:F-box domain-containing protein n=1 Tax=Ceraceosorus bombacis TaxID=401625 RepID=A0A0P1BSI9_9BASI|nr:hypothetical protein CBOM_06708 [Ceraceosorus bombacis]